MGHDQIDLPPGGERMDVASLSRVFGDTTNSYKFYWLLAILDALQETGQTRLCMTDLSLRMIAKAWYPLDYFKLSFGKQDGFKPIAAHISDLLVVDHRPAAPGLIKQIKAKLDGIQLAAVDKRLGILLNWVPYRFIRPFFAVETRGLPDAKVNGCIVRLANASGKAPYRFLPGCIEINEHWTEYLKTHRSVLCAFTYWHLARFLHKHNPHVGGLTEKLEKPLARNLNHAQLFWKKYLAANPGTRCIYSNGLLTTNGLSLDHFLPWSFVAHDQLWNIVPTSKAVNSAKNDWLPSLELYFDSYARLQHNAFTFYAKADDVSMLEDYHVLFAHNPHITADRPFPEFREGLQRQVMPHIQTARNLGFPYPFTYRGQPIS